MAGTIRTLRRGEYRIEVAAGEGPAGVRRSRGRDIAFDIDGGWQIFHVADHEQVYFWWRGEHRHPSVQLARVSPRSGPVDPGAERRRDPQRIQRDRAAVARDRHDVA